MKTIESIIESGRVHDNVHVGNCYCEDGDICRRQRENWLRAQFTIYTQSLIDEAEGMRMKMPERGDYSPSEGISVAYDDTIIERSAYNSAIYDLQTHLRSK